MVGYHQTNQKTDTGKTLTRWPVLVDHNSAKERDALSYASNESRRRLIKLTRTRKTSSNRQFLSRYKRFIGCQNCGEKEPIVLDLHHDNPGGKEGDPSNLCSRSRKRLKEEVRKCIVLCANCHRKVHAGLLDIKK